MSHCHLDHTGLLPYLRQDLPVFTSSDTYHMLQALDAVSDGPRTPLAYRPTPPETWVEFGPLRLQFVHVDHGTPGASAIFIETPDMRFVYSGDLRLHDLHSEETQNFIARARAFRPHVLLIEGTRANDLDSDSKNVSELDVLQGVLAQAQQAIAGLYFTAYERHPERLRAFSEAARATNRTLVLDPATAYLYHHFEGVSDFSVWKEDESTQPAPLTAWLQVAGIPQIGRSEVRGNERAFLAQIRYERLHYFVDIVPQQAGRYLHSDGTPLGPFQPAWSNLMRWLEHFSLEFVPMSSSGHATLRDVTAMIEQIHPDVCMPLHSLIPSRVGSPLVPRLLPDRHCPYSLNDVWSAVPPTTAELTNFG
ncbi:MBL fold metallo-hydrolase [Alicyclobacillus acidoterrestris]|uniref:MBL fold metallo-hydrolase n=1 Tax=Alicyclobacillus acidoterrestris TaxID=1450 RepID=UPI0022A94335|nr:MBL fold metallo-hydrolase [Alicyclobacillus acidoterrestris]